VKSGDISLCNLIEGSEGVVTGFEPSKPESCNKSRHYFLWHKEIPLWEWATWRPKKYFNVPRSSILKAWFRTFLIKVISVIESPARMMSSTYTRRMAKLSETFLVNKEASEVAC